MTQTTITTKQLEKTLSLMIPGLFICEIRDYNKSDAHMDGLVIGREKTLRLPSSDYVFDDIEVTNKDFTAGVNVAFVDWLESVGWFAEAYDESAIYLVRLSDA